MLLILVTAVLAFAGGFIQTASGFGAGIVMMLGLPYFMGLPEAAALAGVALVALNIVNTHYLWYAVRRQTVLVPCIFFVLGDIVSVHVVQDIDTHVLKMVFGVFLIILSIYFLRFSEKATVHATLTIMVSFGFLSGLFDGFFSIGGPLLVLYYIAVTPTKDEYLASVAFSFLVATITSTGMRLLEGILTPSMLGASIVGIVAILIGQRFGQRVAEAINEKQLRTIVYYLIGFSGLSTVLTTWLNH